MSDTAETPGPLPAAATHGTTPFTAPRPRDRRHLDRAVEAAPLIAVALIAALLGFLVWFADRSEREEAGLALIRDTLWVEQALRFQIEADQAAVERLALDLGDRPAETVVVARLRAVAAAHPELVALEWRDAAGGLRTIVPPDAAPSAGRVAEALRPAHGFAAPRLEVGRGHVADLSVPIFENGVRVGSLTARLHLERLLTEHVPWWITQKSLVALVDRDGGELARKSSLPREPEALRHDLAFDPPLPGVTLSLAANREPSNLTGNSLVATIFGLALVAVVSIFALMRHYRRRLAAEESLGEAQALRRAMEESLTVGMRARDLDDRIIYVNPAFCRMVGWRAEEIVGLRPPLPYWLPDLVDETLARHHTLAHQELKPISFETRFRRRDGTLFDVLVYEAPLIDARGVHRGWMGSIIDVTDRKRAEELERRQNETMTRTARLISMGEMASTISHELNQPLAAISSYATGSLNLIRAGHGPADLVEALEKLEVQAQRAGRIVRRVHDFVRKREPRFAAVDVVALVADLAGFVAPEARKTGIEVDLDLPDAPAPVTADRVLLEQVLFNLVRNGMEAMAATPARLRRLEISVHRRDRHDPSPGHAAVVHEVVVEVADRGPGIPPEVAEKLFSPFFSTKPEGMGMGLNICRSIVELHQGRLEFSSRPEGGTLFTLALPTRIPETEPASPAKDSR
ncbi:MAG: PAS domain S-box protein [Siculibacillus sp.]|nr:PAS domain S-box protein [Siculibacillus sp.]